MDPSNLKVDELTFLLCTVIGVGVIGSGVVLACFLWFRREQQKLQRRLLAALRAVAPRPDEMFVTSPDIAACGELVAQFKVNRGKQVISVMESEGRRFIHVEGELSAPERAQMVRYLKAEGFMA